MRCRWQTLWRKGASVARRRGAGLVLSADTTCAVEGAILKLQSGIEIAGALIEQGRHQVGRALLALRIARRAAKEAGVLK